MSRAQSGRPIAVDISRGEIRSSEYLHINPFGQVPAVEFEDGRCLGQSNAILRHLARDSDLLPSDPFTQAKIDEMLFWEQYSHEPYIAVCRFAMVYQGRTIDEREAWRVERGEAALDLMEAHLEGRRYLVAECFSIADIGLLAYTRLAPEGGFSLDTRPGVRQWIKRCEQKLGLPASSDTAE